MVTEDLNFLVVFSFHRILSGHLHRSPVCAIDEDMSVLTFSASFDLYRKHGIFQVPGGEAEMIQCISWFESFTQ